MLILLAMCNKNSKQMDQIQPTIKGLIKELAFIYLTVYNSIQACFTPTTDHQRHLEGTKAFNCDSLGNSFESII